ncbi:MAG: hypothetical protein ACJ76H_10580 [Bacteriovoracaceae bacterium]
MNPMSGIDPYLIVFTIIGILIVLVAWVFFALLKEGAKMAHEAIYETEKKKKEEEKRKRAA